MRYLATDRVDVEAERQKRRETYLKIWRWDEKNSSWALNTRIAQPHADYRNEQANRTFHLAAHPTKARFATIGEDNSLRLWRPRTKGDETSWFAKSVVKLGRSAVIADHTMDFFLPDQPTIGRLAYSNDGSVLAVCLQDDTPRRSAVVHLLDGETGEVRGSETGLVAGHLVGMGFLDRCLILFSNELRVWDVIIGTMVFSKWFGKEYNNLPLSHKLATSHLAISVQSQSFAVAGVGIGKEAGTSILVFRPTDAQPVFVKRMRSGPVSALVPLIEGNGYVILNSQAEFRKLTTHVVPVMREARASLSERNTAVVEEVADVQDVDEMEDVAETSAAQAPTLLEDDPRAARSKLSEEVFAIGSGGGMPNMRDMWSGLTNSLFPLTAN
jgi:NET1-associated nuclear protein 1 (U3 small nucleolar RNA-associated protein 17)